MDQSAEVSVIICFLFMTGWEHLSCASTLLSSVPLTSRSGKVNIQHTISLRSSGQGLQRLRFHKCGYIYCWFFKFGLLAHSLMCAHQSVTHFI